MRHTTRPGFTLMEVLIACVLTGIVMALAMRGFSDMSKIASATSSKSEARSNGTSGLMVLSDLFRQASIIYYDGHPLKPQSGTVSNADMSGPLTLSIPSTLHNIAAPNVTTVLYTWNNTTLNSAALPLKDFRFADFLGTNVLKVAPSQLVTTGAAQDQAYYNIFSSPLAYWATATYSNKVNASGQNAQAALPVSWTFYVLYLAPMSIGPNDANRAYASVAGQVTAASASDNFTATQARPGSAAGVNMARTPVPYELRLLTIPNILAGSTDTNGGYSGSKVQYRAYDPLNTSKDSALDPPYDYDYDGGNGKPNYDPVAIPEVVNGTPWTFLKPGGTSNYYYQPPGSAPGTPDQNRPPSGQRIADAGNPNTYHANFDWVGNDPPTDTALGTQVPAGAAALGQVTTAASDRVIVRYIDPDSTDGTCIRLLNNVEEPSAWPAATAAAGVPYRRYINAYGGEYRWNDYWTRRANWTVPTNWSGVPNGGSKGPGVVPARVFISLTTRYRSTRAIPFQFSTVSTEVDLTGVTTFAQIRPMK